MNVWLGEKIGMTIKNAEALTHPPGGSVMMRGVVLFAVGPFAPKALQALPANHRAKPHSGARGSYGDKDVPCEARR